MTSMRPEDVVKRLLPEDMVVVRRFDVKHAVNVHTEDWRADVRDRLSAALGPEPCPAYIGAISCTLPKGHHTYKSAGGSIGQCKVCQDDDARTPIHQAPCSTRRMPPARRRLDGAR